MFRRQSNLQAYHKFGLKYLDRPVTQPILFHSPVIFTEVKKCNVCIHYADIKKADLDSSDSKSYQPISNLSVLSKLIERLVRK